MINPKVPASEIFPKLGRSLIENSANQEQHVRGCGNPDRNRLAVASTRPLPKAQIALAGYPGAKERLGGRAVLALCRGRCAMSRAARLKSAATCLSAGFHPPAARSVSGYRLWNAKPKDPHHDHRKTYVSAASGVRGFVFASTRYRKPESERRIGESGKPSDGLSRRNVLAGLAVLPAAIPATADLCDLPANSMIMVFGPMMMIWIANCASPSPRRSRRSFAREPRDGRDFQISL